MVSHLSMNKTLIFFCRFRLQIKYWKHMTTYHTSLLSNSCEFLHRVTGPNHALGRIGSIPIPLLKWFIFPFLLVRPNICSILGSKCLEGLCVFHTQFLTQENSFNWCFKEVCFILNVLFNFFYSFSLVFWHKVDTILNYIDAEVYYTYVVLSLNINLAWCRSLLHRFSEKFVS